MKAMPATVLVVIVLGGLWLCLWRRRWRFLGLVPIAIGMLYPLYTSTPDFIVTADGKEWAARMADGKLAVSNLDREHFTVDQWQKRLGSPDLVDIYELPPGEQQLRCDQAGCVYHHGKSIMAMPQLEAAALKDCERANIVVAPFSIGDCDAAFVIDEAELWHHGAHVIYFNGNDTPRIEYTRARRGMRPWSVGWKGD
jgi:competence protein ComEC